MWDSFGVNSEGFIEMAVGVADGYAVFVLLDVFIVDFLFFDFELSFIEFLVSLNSIQSLDLQFHKPFLFRQF